jgi:hypothetical protein
MIMYQCNNNVYLEHSFPYYAYFPHSVKNKITMTLMRQMKVTGLKKNTQADPATLSVTSTTLVGMAAREDGPESYLSNKVLKPGLL